MASMRDKVRKRAEERSQPGGGSLIYTLPEGREFFKATKEIRLIDILPYKVSINNHPEGVAKGDLWFRKIVFVHFGIGAEEKSYICPLKTPGIGQRCPICENRADLLKADPEGNKELIAQLKPKERELYNVIDLKEKDKGVQFWDMSRHLFGKALDEEIKTGDEEWAGFAELKGGHTLKVRFSEKKLGAHTFFEASRIDFVERDTDYKPSILEDVLDLDTILKVLSYEELEMKFLGTDTDAPAESGSVEEEEAGEVEDDDLTKKAVRNAVDKDDKKDAKKEKTEEETPRRRRRVVKEEEEEKSEDSCPKGHTFGDDNDATDDCPKCDNAIWEKCSALFEQKEKEKKSKR